MSVNEAYLVVRSDSDAAVDEAVAGELQRWVREVCPQLSPQFDHPADWGADANWRRQYLHLPGSGGWSLLIDTARQHSDPELARALSRRLKTTVVWTLVLGSCYHWRYRIYDNGREVRALVSPEDLPELQALLGRGDERRGADESSASVAFRGPMPRYEDVEAALDNFLERLGVPKELRLVTRDRCAPADAAHAGRGSLLSVEGLRAGIPVVKVRAQALAPPPAEPAVPVSFDGVARNEQGVRYFLERRRIFGIPSPADLERLLELEREIRNRYEYPFLEIPDGAAPEIRFHYRHEDPGGDPLDARLKARRAAYERARPTQRAFLRLALRVLAKRYPRLRIGARVRFGFQLFPAAAPAPDGDSELAKLPAAGAAPEHAAPGVSWLIRLDHAYEEYRQRPGDLSPAAFLARFFEKIFHSLQGAPPADWAIARKRLLPRLRLDAQAPSGEPAEALGEDDLPLRAVAPGLAVGLVYESPQGLVHVHAGLLRAWNVAWDDAYALALRNLEARTPANLDGARMQALRGEDGGRVCTLAYDDPHTAARILLPGFRKALLERLGDTAALLSLAERDLLALAAESDLFGVEALARNAPALYRLCFENVSGHTGWTR
ncbi:MAG: hypothetical protein HS116_16900 [Planctomycetes bacterium]|nr:hypothetical protein [Planctomycetota bacterium]